MLYGVGRADPITLAAVAAILGGVALLASWAPARRAASTDPAVVLKE
jgi:ABC-type lipoprotein release transport system permease subunit